MDVKDMNEGVQMVLARIASHPEEFVDSESTYSGKWHNLVEAVTRRIEGTSLVLSYLSDDEVQAIYDELRQARRDAFTASVMRKITGSENSYDLQEQFHAKLKMQPVIMPSQSANLISASHPSMNTWGTPAIASSTTPIKP